MSSVPRVLGHVAVGLLHTELAALSNLKVLALFKNVLSRSIIINVFVVRASIHDWFGMDLNNWHSFVFFLRAASPAGLLFPSLLQSVWLSQFVFSGFNLSKMNFLCT